MPPPSTITLAASEPWKPTRDQVRAAAMAFARVSGAEWLRLPASSREDFLIDGHAALVAAHAITSTHVVCAARETVCMTKQHADLYAALFRVCEEKDWLISTKDLPRSMELADQLGHILAQLRSLASPERTTP